MSPDFFFHINHSIPFLQKQGNFDNPKDLLRILVTVHTPLSREVFWHEYAKIPRHTSQKFHCRRQFGMNFGYVTVNGVSSNVSYRLFFRILLSFQCFRRFTASGFCFSSLRSSRSLRSSICSTISGCSFRRRSLSFLLLRSINSMTSFCFLLHHLEDHLSEAPFCGATHLHQVLQVNSKIPVFL